MLGEQKGACLEFPVFSTRAGSSFTVNLVTRRGEKKPGIQKNLTLADPYSTPSQNPTHQYQTPRIVDWIFFPGVAHV